MSSSLPILSNFQNEATPEPQKFSFLVNFYLFFSSFLSLLLLLTLAPAPANAQESVGTAPAFPCHTPFTPHR
ncbi:hypothetical protein LX32DRAFT_641671, partial [Colletotrichum zoysiae]